MAILIYLQCGKIKHINDFVRKDIMNVVFLGLGGNLGDRIKNLNSVISDIHQDCGEIIKQSSIYETEAWGSTSQKKYLNMVVKLNTRLSPQELIKKTGAIEQKLGRKRNNDQNSDRSIDIDILFFNNDILSFNDLQIPHPRLHLRKFVLIPLAEIESKLIHPLLKKNITDLLNSCSDTLRVTLLNE